MEARYLKFVHNSRSQLSFVGRQPSHLPTTKPWPQHDDPYLGFFMQIWVEGSHLPLPDIVCLQFYQPTELGDDPSPIVVPIKKGNPINKNADVLLVDRYGAYDIEFETRREPDEIPPLDSQEFLGLMQPKLGGLNPWRANSAKGENYLGQITEHPIGLNFGGTSCVLYLSRQNEIRVEMR